MQTQTKPYLILSGSHGVKWLREGWALFKRDMAVWTVISVVWWLIESAAGGIPLIGMFAPVMSPFFLAGMVLGCDHVRRGNRLDISFLFSAFQEKYGALLILGLLNVAADLFGDVLGTAAAAAMGATGLIATINSGAVDKALHDFVQSGGDPAAAMNQLSGLAGDVMPMLSVALNGLLAWMMVKLFFAGVIAIAFFYAPARVVLGKEQAWPALKSAWNANADNLVSLTVFSLAYIAAFALPLLPALLFWFAAYLFGWGWLVLAIPLALIIGIPVGIVSTAVGTTAAYAAYCDVFSYPPNQALAREEPINAQ